MILKDKEFSTYDLLKMLKNTVKQVPLWHYSEKDMTIKINSVMYDYVNEGRVQLFGHMIISLIIVFSKMSTTMKGSKKRK
jgi:hypothetical protein